MAKTINTFTTGDWIVHRHHGIGQIKARRSSCISGEPTTYYELETADSTIWIPQEQLGDDMLRPIISRQAMEEVIAVFRRAPRKMATSFNVRKNQINLVQREGVPLEMARLVRDLRARQQRRGSLSNTEQHVLRSVTRRLVNEWAICMGIAPEVVQERIGQLMQRVGDNSQGPPETAVPPGTLAPAFPQPATNP